MARIYLTGSGWFGQAVLADLMDAGHEVVGICSPTDGRHGGPDALYRSAHRLGLDWRNESVLSPDAVGDADAILAAHSHAFVGRRTRAQARVALGYHPSLLPLHRGRDAVKWQARNRERVVGGTVFHLSDRVDGGPIAWQEYRVVDPEMGASALWRDVLAPLGRAMLRQAAEAVGGRVDAIPYRPQDDRLATWEPSLDAHPLYRPELLELGR